MPQLDTSLEEETLLRLMAFGPGKTRKTWWAGTAAEAGFNVILLDSDDGCAILKNLSPAARKRIYRVNIGDTKKRAVAAEFMTWFCKMPSIFWNETDQKRMIKPDVNCIQLDWARFDRNTVVICDSYSALCWSLALRYCIENQIDLADASKTEWDGYRFCGQLATWMLGQLHTLPCHFILIGHQEVYEKYVGTGRDRKIDWTRTQMKSVSGPHAMTIAKGFDEVLYFTIQGSSVSIDLRPEKDRDGGGRVIPPGRYKWEDLSFKEVCKLASIPLPPADLMPVSELVACREAPASATTNKLLGGKSKAATTLATNTQKPTISIGKP